jgi:hypothetical protein
MSGERSKGVRVSKKEVEGPVDFVGNVFDITASPVVGELPLTRNYSGMATGWEPARRGELPPRVKVLEVRLVSAGQESFEAGLDLTAKVGPDGALRVSIPGGRHVLYVVSVAEGFKDVLGFAPGKTVPRLDHFNENAAKKYLDSISTALRPSFDGLLGNGLRSAFCDSLELGGEDWAQDFPREFEKRRGYSVTPFLPFLLDHFDVKQRLPFAETLRRVNYDFVKTRDELIRERFIAPFAEWCRRNGLRSRMQAYGRPWLGMDAKRMIDIPEAECWFFFGTPWTEDGVFNPVENKITSSAAHQAGRRIVSCETTTNYRMYYESLADIKQEADTLLLTGINQMMLTVYIYSPPDVPFPGWGGGMCGSYYSEFNTWWPYLRHWTDYTARLCWLFQKAEITHGSMVTYP